MKSRIKHLPSEVAFDGSLDTLRFVYASDGRKLGKSSSGLTRSWEGNQVYVNGVLDKLMIEDGYISASDSSYHYFVYDHLGNVRAVTDAESIWQRSMSGRDHGFGEGDFIAKEDLWIELKEENDLQVNNTIEAVIHYYNGDGKTVDVGDKAIEQIISSDNFIKALGKMWNGEDVSYVKVDLRFKTFHIGRTGIPASTSTTSNYSQTSFLIFDHDGFWDPLALISAFDKLTDGPGKKFELFGNPYEYGKRTRTYYYNPKTKQK